MIDIPPVRTEITVYEGAYFYKEFTIVDSAGTAVDVTGWTGTGTAVPYVGGTSMGTFTVAIVTGTSGIISVELQEADTEDMSVGAYEILLTTDEATPRTYGVRYGPLDFIVSAN